MDTDTWQSLMDRVVEQAEYKPGQVLAPGGGSAGGDPFALRYADLGPLAFILNEAVDATVIRGADLDDLLDEVVEEAGEVDGVQVTRADIDAVLADKLRCPDQAILQAFASVTSIDLDLVIDAATRGGCTNYGAPGSPPPGY